MAEAASISSCGRSGEVSDYYDDELDSGERARVERHIRECAACAECLRQLGLLAYLLESAFKGRGLLAPPAWGKSAIGLYSKKGIGRVFVSNN